MEGTSPRDKGEIMKEHCGNERLYERLDEAIERGEITEQEARDIYKEESE